MWLVAAALLGGIAFAVMRSRAEPEESEATPLREHPMEAGTALIATATATDAGGAVIAPTVVPTAPPRSDGGVLQAATTDAGAVIVDLGAYAATTDKRSLLGRRVEFSNVHVTRVLSDRVFTVTSGTGELYALLDDALNNGPIEQRVVVQPGQLLDIQGSFRQPPTAETVDEQNRPVRLSPAAAEALGGQQAYLHVTTIRGSAVH